MAMDIGGAETHILELSRKLKKRGLDVTIASNGGAYEAELADCGIRHVKIPCHSKNPMHMIKAYKLLRELILKERYDVVHAHARIPAFLCEKLHKKYRFRFVTTAHWVFNPQFPYNILAKWGCRSLAVSDDIKAYLSENYGILPENVRVTINGIDLDKFSKDTDCSEIEKEFSLTPDVVRIVYVSRMDEDRSYAAHKLIEIMPALDEQFRGLEAVIVGGGNDFDNVKNEAEEVNRRLGRRAVILTGSRTDINKFAAAGDLFIGVSRSALEAMACEVPSIIAGNEGYIGIFDEDKLDVSIATNFCCRGCGETTAETLLKDVRSVLGADDAEKARLGRYGRDTIRRHYSMETMADDALKLYISAIKQSLINDVDTAEMDSIESYLAYNPMSPSGKKYDVLISGYYGYGNMGDDSILETMISRLRKTAPEIRIAALTKRPAEDSKRFGIPCVRRMNIFKVCATMRRSRLLISGGGSLFQDTTSSKSLKYYAFIVNTARALGMKTYIYANGVGIIRYEQNKVLTAKTVKKADKVTVRDSDSLEELVSIGVPKEMIALTADPAFMMSPLPKSEVRRLRESYGIGENERYFAVSLRRFDGVQKNAYRESDLLSAVTASCAAMAKKHGIKPVFVSMQEGLDLELSRLAKTQLAEKYGVDSVVISPANGRELLSLLRGTDDLCGAEFVCAMRLHILIYACSAAVPVIGLSLDPKIDAFMDALIYSGLISVPELTEEKLTCTMKEMLCNRETHATELEAESVQFKSLAESEINAVYSLL